MIDDAFVFDCVGHIFNFDPKNAFGNARPDVRQAPVRVPPAADPGRRADPAAARSSCSEWSVDEIYEMVIEDSDTDMIVAQPLPLTDLFHDGLSPWEKCAEMAGQAPGPRGLLGLGQPAGGQEGARPDGAPGRGLRRARVQVLQRPLRLRAAVPVAHGRPAHRLPDLREGPGARREPDRRAQGRAARPAADRAHPHVRHGRGGGQLPRHQLRHLPRRAAVARRGPAGRSSATRTCTRRSRRRSTSSSRQPRVFAEIARARCCGGAARTRSSTAARRRSGTRSGRCERSGTSSSREDIVRGRRLPAAHRPGQAQDPRREPRSACTAWTSPTRGPGRQRSPRGSSSGGKSW